MITIVKVAVLINPRESGILKGGIPTNYMNTMICRVYEKNTARFYVYTIQHTIRRGILTKNNMYICSCLRIWQCSRKNSLALLRIKRIILIFSKPVYNPIGCLGGISIRTNTGQWLGTKAYRVRFCIPEKHISFLRKRLGTSTSSYRRSNKEFSFFWHGYDRSITLMWNQFRILIGSHCESFRINTRQASSQHAFQRNTDTIDHTIRTCDHLTWALLVFCCVKVNNMFAIFRNQFLTCWI